MLSYTFRRTLPVIPTLLATLTLVFIVVRIIPGDPATAALGDYASKEAVDALREQMGLNESIPVQYVTFLGELLRGDLGESMITGMSVSEQVAYVLPYSVELAVFAVLFGVALGIPIGVYTAVKRNLPADHVGRVLSLVGLSVPAFYLSVLMMLLFAIKLDWFPATGGGDLSDLGDNLSHLILPGVTLGLIMTASVTRLTRSAMLNILSEDYVRTAHAKGLKGSVVILQHALRSALVPILSVIGIWTVGVIGSSVTTEIVFVRPGLGKLLVHSIMRRDYTTLQSVMVIYAAIVAIVNLLTDLTYGLVDPRVKY